MTALVSLSALTKAFGPTLAVDDVTCELHGGEIVGLLGPNGCGKSTTLRLLMGMLRPSRGRARIAGFDCEAESREVKERVGYVADEPDFFPFLSGQEHLDVACRARQMGEEAKPRIELLVDRFQIRGNLGLATSSYSLGMRKKLALVLAAMHLPSVLLLDEPLNGLDLEALSAATAWMQEAKAQGAVILIATHDVEFAGRVCDRLLLLREGRLVADCSPVEALHRAGLGAQGSLVEAVSRLAYRTETQAGVQPESPTA